MQCYSSREEEEEAETSPPIWPQKDIITMLAHKAQATLDLRAFQAVYGAVWL